LRVHWGLKEQLDPTDWHFLVNQGSIPHQSNGWDCGLYAIHYGFCFGLQASMSGITKERISLYRKKLILYMLDGFPQRSILLTKPIWYEDFIVESSVFPVVFFLQLSHLLSKRKQNRSSSVWVKKNMTI
jgi:hypothetical protein